MAKERQERTRHRGQYARELRCDVCGHPICPRPGDAPQYCTDSEVTAGGDGPGFYICMRPRCMANPIHNAPPEERAVHYTAQRARNEARWGRP
jgi:hypothetical protein